MSIEPMTGPEARAIRERLGLRVEDMAGTLALTPHVVEGWESGAARVPREIARDLRWRDALAVREALFEAKGLGACEWENAWSRRFADRASARGLRKALAELDAHVAGCPTCRARDELAMTLPPLPEPPTGHALRFLGRLSHWIDQRPQWLHAPLWTGAGFAAITTLRVAAALTGAATRGGSAALVYTGLAAIPVSATVGFSVGLIWTAFAPLRRRGRLATIVANVLSGILIIAFFAGVVFIGDRLDR